jgi:phosphatidate cytidylyltransferase
MLKTRVITAIALLGIFLPVLWFAPLMYLGALIAIVITLAAWEWWRLLFPDNQRRAFSYAGLCLLNLVAWLIYADIEAVKILLWLTLGFWLLVVPFIMKQSLQLSLQSWRWPLAAIGLFILPACWFALMHLRAVSMALFLSVLVLVWAADIGAYFAGKAFGKHKLAKQLSPGKSIEGAVGGVFITTSTFTKEALEYAHKHRTSKIELIDGPKLGRLMQEYEIGVIVRKNYKVMDIDENFFFEE